MKKFLSAIAAAATIGTLTLGASPAMAAGYLKIGDIKGESTDAASHAAGDEHEVEYDVAKGANAAPGAGPRVRAVTPRPARPAAQDKLAQPQDPQEAGLLLPAVQKAREAANR